MQELASDIGDSCKRLSYTPDTRLGKSRQPFLGNRGTIHSDNACEFTYATWLHNHLQCICASYAVFHFTALRVPALADPWTDVDRSAKPGADSACTYEYRRWGTVAGMKR